MGKKNLEGQIDLFSLIDSISVTDDDIELPVITTEINIDDGDIIAEEDKGSRNETAVQNGIPENTKEEPKKEIHEELELEEGDIIWAVIDKKIESHIIIKVNKDHCITQSEDGQKRRLTGRSKGIVWESTREQAQKLCNKYYT